MRAMRSVPSVQHLRWPVPVLVGLSSLMVMLMSMTACGGEAAEKPRAVILMIGDGLGPSQIALARYARLARGERFAFESMPVTGLVSTWSASNAVTDSAAAATTLASGVKTNNQIVGFDPEGQPVPRISEAARNDGWRIGYVTNTEITHATPAGFYGTVENRYLEVGKIAEQLIRQAPDVAIGGGWHYFVPRTVSGTKRWDDKDLLAEAKEGGYTVLTPGDSLDLAHPPEKLLALLAGGHIPYELDNDNLPEPLRYPSLEQLTEAALAVIGRDDEPFFLMIEGGRIDHAGHAFDAAGVVAQVAAFDRAVQRVLEYQRQHPDVLVLLTADHATGGLAVTDFTAWENLENQENSVEWMVSKVRDEDEPAGSDLLGEASGYADFDPERTERIRNGGDSYEARRTLGTYLSEYNHVTWMPRVYDLDPTPEERIESTGGHTGEDVPLYAIGPGAERFGGVLDNSDIPQRLASMLGWTLDASAIPEI